MSNTSTSSTPSSSKVIKNSIRQSEEHHYEFIRKLIAASEEKILSEIDREIVIILQELTDLSERVTALELKSQESANINDKILEMKRKILKQENSVVASSFRIVGIPYHENENLHKLFGNICDTLNITIPRIANTYRLNKIYKNNKTYTQNDSLALISRFLNL
ncbi:hypothetical protein FF38_09245 [Lucilia cuprina]|uniref:DUF4806 domain-containing protein n=1 Tax=Lucilia cuprina TaxID=7375 RepID=A0A0L0CNG1_LUCCU|nr:hypothetical protein FF38_09245 [Lucilia cuprina]